MQVVMHRGFIAHRELEGFILIKLAAVDKFHSVQDVLMFRFGLSQQIDRSDHHF